MDVNKIINSLILTIICILISACSSIKSFIVDNVSNKYLNLQLTDNKAESLYETKEHCIRKNCINYLLLNAKSFNKSLVLEKGKITSFSINSSDWSAKASYNDKYEYQKWGEKYQGVVVIFPGYGVASSILWLYASWLSDTGHDVIIMPGSSQQESFDFGYSLVEHALFISKEFKNVKIYGASLGFLAALDMASKSSNVKHLIGLAPFIHSNDLATGIKKSGWVPSYLNWLSIDYLNSALSEVAEFKNVTQQIERHNKRLAEIKVSTLLIMVEDDKILPVSSTLNFDNNLIEVRSITGSQHEVISSLPIKKVRKLIFEFNHLPNITTSK